MLTLIIVCIIVQFASLDRAKQRNSWPLISVILEAKLGEIDSLHDNNNNHNQHLQL